MPKPGNEETVPLVDNAADDKAEKKKAKEKSDSEWPQFSKRKVKKGMLEAAVVACYRLEYSQQMQVHVRLGFVVVIITQLICQLIQFYLLLVFNLITVNGQMARYTPAAVETLTTAIKGALGEITPTPLGAIQATTCQLQQAHPWLGYLMMFIWLSMMTSTIVRSLELTKLIVHFPLVKPTPRVKEEKEEKKNKEDENTSYVQMGKDKDKVNHMPIKWKLFTLVFILGPNMMCNFYVAGVGIKFLALTGNPAVLIMKALTLKFIMAFDQLFYLTFASEQFRKYMKPIKYVWERDQRRNHWNSWLSTYIKLFVVLTFTALSWTQYSHLLELRRWCREYIKKNPAACLGNSCGVSFSWR